MRKNLKKKAIIEKRWIWARMIPLLSFPPTAFSLTHGNLHAIEGVQNNYRFYLG